MRGISAATMLALTCAMTACSDTASSRSYATVGPQPSVAASLAAKPKVKVTPAEFHARSRMDWAGVAHTQAMDALRDEIRKNKPKDLCKVIERIGVDDASPSPIASALSPADLHRIRKAAADSIGCHGPRAGAANAAGGGIMFRAQPPVMVASGSAPGRDIYDLSPNAWALVDAVSSAGDGAASAGDLATELSAITSVAYKSLSSEEASIIDALASVSLSSFEYWTENGQAMAQEMADAYGPCVAAGGTSCGFATGWHNPVARHTEMVALASFQGRDTRCPINSKLIWTADKWGAGAGMTIGLKVGGVVGAIVGLVAGAVIGSGAVSTYEFAQYVWCAYHT